MRAAVVPVVRVLPEAEWTARAAAALRVHGNTVTQRLERIGRLLGPGWTSPDRALEIQLALRLHRLTGPDGG